MLFSRFLDDRQIGPVNGNAAISFQEYLRSERNNLPSSINRKVFTLRSFMNYLILKDAPNAHKLPFKNLLKIRDARPLRANYLKPEQIKILFAHINRRTVLGLRDYAIYACMYLLAMRVGEVHGLNIADVDLENSIITITGKRHQKRILKLTMEMKTILSAWLAVCNNVLNSLNNKALFISKKGRRLAIRTMEANFQKLIQLARLKTTFHITCHTLRHSCATELNEKKVDLLTIQNILGHSSLKTTMTYYVHATEDMIRNALEQLPLVKFLDERMANGEIDLSFQNRYLKRTG